MAINTTKKAGCPISRVLCEKCDSRTARSVRVAQRFSSAKKCAHLQRALATEVSSLLVIPPPPLLPAPATSVEFASAPARVRCCRTIPAGCALRRPNHRRRWQQPPAPATTGYSHRSTPAVPAPRCSTAHPQRESHAGSAPPPPVLLPGGCRSPPLRNSLPKAVSAPPTASPLPSFHLPPHDSAPAAAPAPVAPSPPSRSSGCPPSCWPTRESNSPKSPRESLRC